MEEVPQTLPSVVAPLNYLKETPTEKPAFYIRMALPENARKGPQLGPREMPIHDARSLRGSLSLDKEGMDLVDSPTPFTDFYDADHVRTSYYPEIEELVERHTGAARVIAFDHNLRSKALAREQRYGAQLPVLFAHNDYTEDSGPQRVRDLLPDEAEALLEKRFAVINVWRPTRGPVQESPLAVCDAQTMGPNDLVAMDLIYPDRVGEIQSLDFDPGHRWLYFPDMEASEVMLLKCFDSALDGRARFTAHCAFDDPKTPEGADPRESIEVRTLAFFDEFDEARSVSSRG
jgi:hypothetical protein